MDYRRRAEEFRALACGTSDLPLQASYETLARSYDELADYLETTARMPSRQASAVAEQRNRGAAGASLTGPKHAGS
jgi:hypothetical protein